VQSSEHAIGPVPSISGRVSLGDGFALSASASNSFSLPTLAEVIARPHPPGSLIEQGSLLDAGLEYDDLRRVRLTTMVFDENLTGFDQRQTTGVGAAVTWQVVPRLSLRAWTLHDAADSQTQPVAYLPFAPLSLSRAVAWASYEVGGGLRLDAIVHRDLADGPLASSPAETDVDGDVVLPLARGIAATVGSSRSAGKRTFYAGLRLP